MDLQGDKPLNTANTNIKSPKFESNSKKDVNEIKRNIEDTVNFTTVKEGLQSLSKQYILITRIQCAFDSFETQTGRKMTYSEMREMMG